MGLHTGRELGEELVLARDPDKHDVELQVALKRAQTLAPAVLPGPVVTLAR
jgi:hypothetical protein